MGVTVAAVDLGGSSGRVMLAHIGPGELALTEAHRIWNGVVRVGGTLHWDALALYRGILDGLRAAGEASAVGGNGRLDAVGIDTWGVDYGLLDATGALLGNPVSYRDERTVGVAARVHERIGADELYAVTGIQELSFNTVYQLAAAEGSPQLAAARTLLMLPDLMIYWLTGEPGTEITVASTTGLLDARTRRWSEPVMRRVGIDPGLFPEPREPGRRAGELPAPLLAEAGHPGPLPVITVGSHDTASALVGTPVATERFGYVSCGTWSLVGLELDKPVLTEASREARFSNELGVDGTVRYLHNVMGLWLLSESLRAWGTADMDDLLARAARLPALASVIDPDAPEFLPPGDMPGRIAHACARLGQPIPESRAHTVRCILDSLALAYRRTLRRACELAGRDIDVVHVVGGGSRNALLCQLTADACERPVLAGPAEAAALGNALMQARALGAAPGSLAGLRRMVAAAHRPLRYEPAGDGARWRAAERLLAETSGYSAS